MLDLAELRRSTRASLCLECGKCTAMCPLALRGEFSARLVARQDADVVVGRHDRGLTLCLTCAACEQRCPQGVRFSEYVRGLRAGSVPSDEALAPHGGFFRSMSLLQIQPPGSSKRTIEWEEGLHVADQGEVAFFVGCLPHFEILFGEERGTGPMEIAQAAVRLLNRCGIEPVVADDERCCGHDLLWSGQASAFESLARANIEAFRKRGVKKILTACAECARTWRIDYAGLAPDYSPEVQHMAEFLAERLSAGELLASPGDSAKKATYQDPCRLGRHLDVRDKPREVLAAISNPGVIEMEHSGVDALCCGTSGFMHCTSSSRGLQAERLSEAEATGADLLVTACPKCMLHLRCAQAAAERQGQPTARIAVEDLTVLAASSLQAPPTTGGSR